MDLDELRPGPVRRHPWELARASIFIEVLRHQGILARAPSVLDVGSGDAWFAQQLQRALPTAAPPITCWDPRYRDISPPRWAAVEPWPSLVADLPRGTFDVVLMLDVLEHVEDDLGFLKEVLTDSLAEDGWVLVSVPAHRVLFSSHDRTLKHFRRYEPRECRYRLEQSGIATVLEGGLFPSLLVLRGFQALGERLAHRERRSAGIGAWKGSEPVTAAVVEFLVVESRLSAVLARGPGARLPGLSYWALGVRSR